MLNYEGGRVFVAAHKEVYCLLQLPFEKQVTHQTTDKRINRLADTERQMTDRKTERQTKKQTERQKDRKKERKKERKTVGQTDRQTDRWTETVR